MAEVKKGRKRSRREMQKIREYYQARERREAEELAAALRRAAEDELDKHWAERCNSAP